MVPISPAEARHLAPLVGAMPPERATEIRKRFSEALAKIEAASLPPRGSPDTEKAAYRKFGLSYFRLGVACPFLEKESCSTHRDRPLVCREYLVTSPPTACAKLGSGQTRQINIPVTVWSVFGRSVSADGSLEWMPLVEALRYTSSDTKADRSKTGPERVAALLRELER